MVIAAAMLYISMVIRDAIDFFKINLHHEFTTVVSFEFADNSTFLNRVPLQFPHSLARQALRLTLAPMHARKLKMR